MGRPKLPKRKISVSVTLDESTKKHYRKIGNGNLSLGIELALKQLNECKVENEELKELRNKVLKDKVMT